MTNPASETLHYIRLAAVFCALYVSANLLTWLGLPYVSQGGSALFKIHPASLMCFAAFLVSRPRVISPLLARRMDARRESLPTLYVACLCFCLVSEIALTGIGNGIVILDSFLPAGFLLVTFVEENARQQLQLQAVLRTGLLINALIAINESLCHTALIPLYHGAASDLLLRSSFRPFALYDHPLTGAAATLIGLFMPPGDGWGPIRTTLYFTLLGLGLLAFAERSAILTAGIIAAAAAALLIFQSVLRRADVVRMMFFLSALILLALVCSLFAYSAGLGERLGDHLYWDASARVRLRQWHVLALLDVKEVLFGIPRQGALALLEPMRLRFGVPVIENSWLLMFMSLGLFGTVFFVCGFGALLLWCAERGRGRGLAMSVGLLAMASSSNALGRKSTLLIVFASAIASLPGAIERGTTPDRGAC